MMHWSLGRGPAAFLGCCAVLVAVLGAYVGNGEPPVEPVQEQVLFGDAQVDAALLALPTVSKELVGREFDALTGLVEADDITFDGEAGDDASASATLPGAVGLVAFVRHAPHVGAIPWRLNEVDQAADTTTWVYDVRREIESVAVSEDGYVLLRAIRRTFDPAADFEAYRVTLAPSLVERLTDTPFGEGSVPMSADDSVLAWRGEDANGKRPVFTRIGATYTRFRVVVVT